MSLELDADGKEGKDGGWELIAESVLREEEEVTEIDVSILEEDTIHSTSRSTRSLRDIHKQASSFYSNLDRARSLIEATKASRSSSAHHKQHRRAKSTKMSKEDDDESDNLFDHNSSQPNRRAKTPKNEKQENKINTHKTETYDDCGSLEDELHQCKSDLEEKNEPKMALLYTQMAMECSIRRERNGNTTEYYLETDRMDPDTYVFADRPYREAYTEETDLFFIVYDTTFADSAPNAAVTMNRWEDEWVTFEGPMISVFLEAAYYDVSLIFSLGLLL